MKTVLLFFSGTGSSLAIAKQVARRINCDIRSITSFTPAEFNSGEYERVGFIYPNYYGHIPEPMARYIRKMDLSAVNYLFGICSAGGALGKALSDLDLLLREKGKRLHYSAWLAYGSNYIVAPYYATMNLSGGALEKRIAKNCNTIRRIVKDIVHCGESKVAYQPLGTLFSDILYGKELQHNRRNLARDFSVSESCKGCGICADICPAENIEMSDRPIWKNSCEDCCACIQVCKSESILYKGKALKKSRYFHPDTSVKELIAYNRGEF